MTEKFIFISKENKALSDLGFQVLESFEKTEKYLKEKEPSLIGFEVSKDNYQQCVNFIEGTSKNHNLILIDKIADYKKMSNLITLANVVGVCNSLEGDQLKKTVIRAIEAHQGQQQKQQLLSLVNDEHKSLGMTLEKLKTLIFNKKDRINKSTKRLLQSTQKVDSLHRALSAVHAAQSILQMEALLHECLNEAFDINLVKITYLSQQEIVEEKISIVKNTSNFSIPIINREGKTQGKVYFCRDNNKKFSKEDRSYLTQIADGIILTLDHLAKIQESEQLKQQWESTFNAISEPLGLCDSNSNILRTNSTFLKMLGLEEHQVIGKNIFESFFNIKPPQEKDYNERLIYNTELNVRGEKKNIEVSLLEVDVKEADIKMTLVLFRDITEQKKLEKQLFESSKMVELGTIGSSIAHELNNPLGGILSFLQLIKMDLSKTSQHYEDILSMEEATYKCKEIVENLLGFARKKKSHINNIFDLKESINKALKLAEIQTRSSQIHVDVDLGEEEFLIIGDSNSITQAIRNVLQNANEAVLEQLDEDPRYDAQIRIELRNKNGLYFLTITDNGKGIEVKNLKKIFNPLFTTKFANNNSGLGLTVAYKIISEHQGHIEIYSQPKIGTSAKVSFERLDFN